MSGKVLGGAIASVLALVVVCAAGAVLVFGGGAAGCGAPLPSGSPVVSAPPGGWRPVGRFDREQVGHAATITSVGTRMGVPHRGWVIAVATAIQESQLRNLPGGPDDSVGLFQQRPSQGWGTRDQLRDPVYAARRFYQALLGVGGWDRMPLAEAADAVQRSRDGSLYARHERDATLLVNTVSGLADPSNSPLLDCAVTVGPKGWVAPVKAPVVSGFRTTDRPGHDGVDLGAARGTPIHAASAGTITTVQCNAHRRDGSPYSCDIDGSQWIIGCGWHVDIRHAAGVLTRYCHMLTRPQVTVGQRVAAGQAIGVVGTSGNSSGPHLHYEVRLRGEPVDPETWHAARQAPLD